jgi:hypothetical protein
MSWLKSIEGLIATRQPYEVIPKLFKQYKMFISKSNDKLCPRHIGLEFYN